MVVDRAPLYIGYRVMWDCSPIVSPFFLAITRNSAPNVSPPLRLNFEMVSFLNALKLEKVSVTPNSLPNVLEAIFSEILSNLVREATTMKFSEPLY